MALDFAAGCLGGCAGVIIGHPFDTVKVKLQTQDYRNPVYRGTWDCFVKILKAESFAGIYRGVSSPMAGVAVVNAIVFGVYGNVQRKMADPDSLRSHFLSGAMAGLIQSVVSSPVELVKTRLQTNSQYSSTVDCFQKTFKQEGVRGVFKGLSITGLREFLGYGLYFSTYEAMTRASAGSGPVGTPAMLLAGGLSGTVSWVFTYPLDVVKSRFQADIGKYSSISDCLKKSISEEGVMFLTRGLTPTILRAFPVNAVTFTVVTWVFRFMDFGATNSVDIKVDTLIEKSPKNHGLKNKILELVETSISNITMGWMYRKHQYHSHFLVPENYGTYGEFDDYFFEITKIKDDPQDMKNFEDELPTADLNEIKIYLQNSNTINNDLENKTPQNEEEHEKRFR